MNETIQKKLTAMDKLEMAEMVEDNLNLALFTMRALEVASLGEDWNRLFESDETTYAIARVADRLEEIRAAFNGNYPWTLQVAPGRGAEKAA